MNKPGIGASGGRPTLKTIAFMTGLGVTTVSRALKDAPDISEATKERVRLVARQIGYRPNRAGVRLRTGKTNVISLVLGMEPEIMSMAGRMVYGINEVLQPTQYHLVVTPHMNNADPMEPIRYIADTGSADGIIISRTTPNDERVRFLMANNIPFVTHGRTEMGLKHAYHDLDNESFSYEATKRLTALGRKRIALIPPPAHLTYTGHLYSGLHRGLREFGGAELPFNGVTIEDKALLIKTAVRDLMLSNNPPDALICSSGSSAIAATAGVEEAGMQLGREVDIASKDSEAILKWLRPQILSANEDFQVAGQELARFLIALISGAEAEDLHSLAEPKWQPL